jgi:hypothetical protein
MARHFSCTPPNGRRRRGVLIALGLLVASLGPVFTTSADVLDDIEVRTEGGIGEIRLTFAVPVRYIKHFPPERSELLKIYLQMVDLSGPLNDDLRGYKRSPPMALVPSYALTYTTARTCFAVNDPLCLDFQFSQPVQYRIRPGEDGRSIIVHILPDSKPATKDTKP